MLKQELINLIDLHSGIYNYLDDFAWNDVPVIEDDRQVSQLLFDLVQQFTIYEHMVTQLESLLSD